MNKSELVDSIAEKSGLTKKDADKALQATIDSVREAMCSNDKVSLVGFGSFEVRYRKERAGRNPATGEAMTIAASYVPAFRPSKTLKEEVNSNLNAE